jgi:O-antigen ligase
MSYFPESEGWRPKYIGLLASPAFFVLVILNKSQWKIRFLDWSLGAIVVGLMLAFFLLRGRISKLEASVVVLPIMWALYALSMTPFVYDIHTHLIELAKVFAITIISTFLIISVFSSSKLTSQTVAATTLVWVVISLALLLLWGLGFFVYEFRSFAGLFSNRNEFAVQSVILMAMFLFFVRGNKIIKAFVVSSSFVLVVSTLSTKGFLFFFFVVFFPLFLKSKIKKKLLFAMIGITLFGAATLSFPNIQDRMIRFSMIFTSPGELRGSESAFLRSWLTVEGAKLAVENPISGVGVHNSRYFLIPPFAQERGDDVGLYSHNNYIEMALNAGLFGLLFFYLPLIFIYFNVSASHPYYVAIKTLTALYLLMGVAMVQYNNFISIVLYSLIVFVHFYNKGGLSRDFNSLCR